MTVQSGSLGSLEGLCKETFEKTSREVAELFFDIWTAIVNPIVRTDELFKGKKRKAVEEE